MNYVFENLTGLAQHLRQLAVRADEEHDRIAAKHTGVATSLQMRYLQAERDAYLRAGEIVRRTLLQDMPLVEEYRLEMEGAVSYAASQIWASMQRHNGDPRWEYASGEWNLHGERRT